MVPRLIAAAQGWWSIVANLECQDCRDRTGLKVHRTKEKLGGLRFYCGLDEVGSGTRVVDLFERAERIAA